ncbi:MAG TPA: helix-turn-helix transcriptional regulator, partial [Terriglobales bacterium]|nr:helix-turn-helix transcriptional regulator [Terriglobales bacterium]
MGRDPNPLFVFFASQLKRLREAKGWSQEALGKRIGYSGEMVSKVETGNIRPSREFAAALGAAFPEQGDMFVGLVDQAERSHSAYPMWFQSWVDAEKRATVLRWWQPLLIPGLLQTADYARAVYEAWQEVDGSEDFEADIAARIARQEIFDRSAPPSFGVVIDETVLHRCIGSPKVMQDQLLHLAELSERPRITVQILPANVGANVGLLGAFAVVGFAGDTPGMAYFETPDEGEVVRQP